MLFEHRGAGRIASEGADTPANGATGGGAKATAAKLHQQANSEHKPTINTKNAVADASAPRRKTDEEVVVTFKESVTLTERNPPSAATTEESFSTALPRSKALSEYKPEKDIEAVCRQMQAAHESSDSKPTLHLVVLGHVDAGKSTLMGRLLYELGVVDDRVVHKYKKESNAAGKGSFLWAWMLDERPEERARGVTVDVAVTHFETPKRSVTLLDAPGHRDFVPNMISGAAQADAALLVVDGSVGGFESGFAEPEVGKIHGGGQTREHAQLARSLGLEQIAVVITKLDECGFDQERFEQIKSVLLPYLRTCGFREESVQWLPAVGPNGENLKSPPQDARLSSWWKGPTLVEVIDSFVPRHRLIEKPLRMPVSEVVARSIGKSGLTVGGKLEGGALCPGTKVLLMPGREIATVKAIEIHKKLAPVAMAGDNADVTLSGIEPISLHAGIVLCHPEYPVPLASRFEARIAILDVPFPLLKGQQVTVHAHAARGDGVVSSLISLIDEKTGDIIRSKPRCLLRGQTAIVEVTPRRPFPLEKYSDYRALGRVALRDQGRTLAVGIVTSIVESCGG